MKIKQNGGGKDEIIQNLKNKGLYEKWVRCGSLFGYIDNNTPQEALYESDNGNKYVSSVVRNYNYKENSNRKIIPVFNFISTRSSSRYDAFKKKLEPANFRKKSVINKQTLKNIYQKNIISYEELKDKFNELFNDKKSSYLILIGENHSKNPDIHMFKQIQIIEMINSFSEKTIPIYSEMPKNIKQILNSLPNNNSIKLSHLDKPSSRLMYYLKYLQIPQNKNYIIPSNINFKDRVGCSCNLEYAEDIKKVCEQNDITIGIFGVLHIKCIKDILNNQRLNNNKTLKIISLSSYNLYDLYNDSLDCYKTIKSIIEDSFILNIPNVSKLGHDLFLKLIGYVHKQVNRTYTPSVPVGNFNLGSINKQVASLNSGAHAEVAVSSEPETSELTNKKWKSKSINEPVASLNNNGHSPDLRSLENLLFNGEPQSHPVKTKSQLRPANLRRIATNQSKKYLRGSKR
jgi:hypothetical protein